MRRSSRRTTTSFVALATLLVGLMAGIAGSSGASASPGRARASDVARATATSVRRVNPLNSAGHLRARYTVAATRKGHCWTSSLVNGHLYRCLHRNLILDPCWKESGRDSVVCLPTPWATRVTRLQLTRKLPGTSSGGPRLWGLRIGEGIHANCEISQGTTIVVGGKPLSYFCQRGWGLRGQHPNRSTPVWTMDTAKRVNGSYVARGPRRLPVAWKPVVH